MGLLNSKSVDVNEIVSRSMQKVNKRYRWISSFFSSFTIILIYANFKFYLFLGGWCPNSIMGLHLRRKKNCVLSWHQNRRNTRRSNRNYVSRWNHSQNSRKFHSSMHRLIYIYTFFKWKIHVLPPPSSYD